MNTRHLLAYSLISIAVTLIGCASQAQSSNALPAPPQATGEAAAQPAPANVDPWPRVFGLNTVTLRVYQPQVEKWEGNRLDFRAAVEATPTGGGTGSFGVIWGTARTEVNRAARLVTLEDLRLTRSNFPTLADKGAAYRRALEQQLSGSARTIALDRLQASLAASGTVHVAGVPVRNEPPRIIVSNSPAILIPVSGQPKEALIANTIPQTASVKRTGGPNFTPVIDGAPQWRSIKGTSLQYVFNSETPIIQVPDGTLYALSAGVWFTAGLLDGPWTVATSVPAAIYTIPPSSPLYYTTFVHVYGFTPEVVYVGYTPGYLGTVVEPDGVVVYGTGYDYTPWVGTVYYAAPDTYGVQAQPVYNPDVDMAYGMALGLTTAALVDSWGGSTYYYGAYYHGYPCCGSTSANVYGHWGDTAVSGTDTWYSNSSGKIGEKSSGTYTNTRTGTTGSYSANRYVNPYQGTAGRSGEHSYQTAGGATGDVSRSETYNAQTGQTQYNASKSATTQGGSTVSRDTTASWGAQGDSASRDTTVTNAQTGQTRTYSSGSNGDDRYASADGQNYRNDGSGWQKQTASGWQSAANEDTSWADREQQARSQGEDRTSSFSQGGFGGGGGGGFGGGSFGGGGGGFASRFGGGDFGSRFGGGGFGGRFGGGRR